MILCMKYNANGSVKRQKARLVAQDFGQLPNILFGETFAPVAPLGVYPNDDCIGCPKRNVHKTVRRNDRFPKWIY